MKPFLHRTPSVILSVASSIAIACVLSACGQRGPLYLPKYPAPVVPAEPPAVVSPGLLPPVVAPAVDVDTAPAEPNAPVAPASPSK